MPEPEIVETIIRDALSSVAAFGISETDINLAMVAMLARLMAHGYSIQLDPTALIEKGKDVVETGKVR